MKKTCNKKLFKLLLIVPEGIEMSASRADSLPIGTRPTRHGAVCVKSASGSIRRKRNGSIRRTRTTAKRFAG